MQGVSRTRASNAYKPIINARSARELVTRLEGITVLPPRIWTPAHGIRCDFARQVNDSKIQPTGRHRLLLFLRREGRRSFVGERTSVPDRPQKVSVVAAYAWLDLCWPSHWRAVRASFPQPRELPTIE